MRFRRTPPDPRDPRNRDLPPPDTAATIVQEDAVAAPVVEEEVYVEPPRRRPPTLWPWLLLLGLLVVGGIVAAILLTRGGKSDRVVVPGVVGLGSDAAVQRVRAKHLNPQVVTRVSRFPRGRVFSQKPGGGTQLKKNSTVTLFVSAVQVVNVPNVVGQKSAAAKAQLRAAGLGTQLVTVASRQPGGSVISQTPAAGQSVPKSSSVVLKVSRGLVAVPDVRGERVAVATTDLQKVGLVPSRFDVPSGKPSGTVVAQNPMPGSRVASGTKVRINVSTGAGATTSTQTGTAATGTAASTGTGATPTPTPATATVPGVVGLGQTAAQRSIRRAGLRAHVVYVSSTKPEGQVVAQMPAAGTSVRRESRVRMNVSLGPNPGAVATVPDVTGQPRDQATTQLRNAGFQVNVINIPTQDPTQDNVVVDEQPTGGTRAPTNQPVTIYVGVLTSG